MPNLSSSSGSRSDYESKLSHRIPCKFQVVVHADALGVFHGFVREIDINSASICLEQNLQNAKMVKLRIHYPTRIIEVIGKLIYSVYSSQQANFRSEIKFTNFVSAADREHLELDISRQTS